MTVVVTALSTRVAVGRIAAAAINVAGGRVARSGNALLAQTRMGDRFLPKYTKLLTESSISR
jgi:hypothetical protein